MDWWMAFICSDAFHDAGSTMRARVLEAGAKCQIFVAKTMTAVWKNACSLEVARHGALKIKSNIAAEHHLYLRNASLTEGQELFPSALLKILCWCFMTMPLGRLSSLPQTPRNLSRGFTLPVLPGPRRASASATNPPKDRS